MNARVCQRCDRQFTMSEDSPRILYDWYVHLKDDHGDDLGREYLARVDANIGALDGQDTVATVEVYLRVARQW